MPRALRQSHDANVRDAQSSHGPFLSSSAIVDADHTQPRNLIVEGRLTAEVPLLAHGVAIGPEGRVQGDIHAAVIRVEGEVVGDLYAEAQVRVCYLASVRGNITSPNVIIEEGASFMGRVSMEEPEPFLSPGAIVARQAIAGA